MVDAGRQRRGTMQRLELVMGILGAFLILALLTLVVALVQGAGSAAVASTIIVLVAGGAGAGVAVWYRKLR